MKIWSTPQPVVMANLDSRHEAVDWERMGRFLLSKLGLPWHCWRCGGRRLVAATRIPRRSPTLPGPGASPVSLFANG